MKARSFKELLVYQRAFELQQEVFELSKTWPNVENYSPTDQVRRSSRSIGANIAESWAKRRYPAHFLSKLTDADGELQETRHWLETAFSCSYIDKGKFQKLGGRLEEVANRLGSMILQHESFCLR